MKSDQILKEIVRHYFAEFMALFFPRIARRLDFSHVEFLDKEMFTDLPEGEEREMDLVVQVVTRTGDIEIVLIHIEFEAKRRGTFPERMYEYYTTLWLRRRRPIVPIVVYLSRGAGGIVTENYAHHVFGRRIMDFRYTAIGLPDLNDTDYLDRDNPLAPVFSSVMQSDEANRARRLFNIVRKRAFLETDTAGKRLLAHFSETALSLSQAETTEFDQLILESEVPNVEEFMTMFERRGYDRAIEQVQIGICVNLQMTLRAVLEAKFGELPESVLNRIQAAQDPDELRALVVRVATANSLAETGLA